MRLTLALLLALPVFAFAADHAVPVGTTFVDCDTYNGGVSAGDRLIMDGGARDETQFNDCIGSVGNHIEIINDPTDSNPVQISDNSTWLLQCTDCEFVTIDGTGGWVGMPGGAYCGSAGSGDNGGTTGCGIQLNLTGSSGTALLRIDGTSTDVIIKGVEIDGNDNGTLDQGIDFNDHNVEDWNDGAGNWRENIVITQNYVHNVSGAGMYIGPNYGQGGLDDRRLRDIEISHNYIHTTGDKGLALKSAFEGTNLIHNNYVADTGTVGSTPGFGAGIQCFEGGCDMYQNWVIRAGEHGVQSVTQNAPTSLGYCPFTSNIYNNVVIGAGVTGPNDGNGVTFAKTSSSGSVCKAEGDIFNNTIISSEANGVNINANHNGTNSEVTNNIAVDSGSTDIQSRTATANTNLTGTIAARSFVNAGADDYHLLTGSDAKDTGTNTGAPSDDFDGISRPFNGTVDVGAYEFTTGGGGSVSPVTANKPNCDTPYTIDTGESLYPDHLWVACEGTGTTVADEGENGTDYDLTLSGADWVVDGTDLLSFVKANGDYAENTAVSGLTGTLTFGVIMKGGATPSLGDQIIFAGDNEEDDRVASLQFDAAGNLRAVSRYDDAADTNTTSLDVSDGNVHLAMMRVSDTTIDVCAGNDSTWDTLAVTKTGLVAAIDTIAFAMKRSLTPEANADYDLYVAFVERGSIASCSAVFNSGNPYPILGIDAGVGEEQPGRGTATYVGGIVP